MINTKLKILLTIILVINISFSKDSSSNSNSSTKSEVSNNFVIMDSLKIHLQTRSLKADTVTKRSNIEMRKYKYGPYVQDKIVWKPVTNAISYGIKFNNG